MHTLSHIHKGNVIKLVKECSLWQHIYHNWNDTEKIAWPCARVTLKSKKRSIVLAPKVQHLVTPCVLQHKCQCIAPKKQHTKKNNEDAAEHAKLLTKRIKEAKGKYQEQIAERHGCPCRDLLILNLVKTKPLRIANKL